MMTLHSIRTTTHTTAWLPQLLLLCGIVVATADRCVSEETASKAIDYPLAIFHLSGVDQLQSKAEVMFAAAGRDDMAENMRVWIKDTLRGLQGMDRTKPLGWMLYLKTDFTGVSFVAYAPVANRDEMLQTITGLGSVRPVDGQTDRYNLNSDNGPDFALLFRGNYVFWAVENDEIELKRNLPDPEKMVQRLSNRFDLAASLMIKSIPPATRLIFVSFLQTQTMAELQQKDNEPDSAYRVRKAQGESVLEFLEKIVTQGDDITLGGKIDEASGQGIIELDVNGSSDNKLTKYFQSMVGRKSLFANLLQQPAMITVSLSLQLDEKQRQVLTELLSYAPEIIDKQANKSGVDDSRSAFDPIFRSLSQAAETGHLDGFFQVAGSAAGEYTFLGGMRVPNAANFPRQLTEALQFTKDKFSSNDRIAALELNAEQIDGLPVHSVTLSPPDRPGQWMFGNTARLYGYATTQALWIAFGADQQAFSALKAGVDLTKKPVSPNEDRKQRAPFVFQLRGNQWVNMQAEARKNEEPDVTSRPQAQRFRQNMQRFRDEMQASFQEENDGLRVEARPSDTGARIRFEFQKGWISALGRMIALRIELGPPQRPNREESQPESQAAPTEVGSE